MNSGSQTILVEGDIWAPGRFWTEAVGAVTGRLARVRAFDDATLAAPAAPAAERVAADVAALRAWAADDIDWRRELARHFDEHLSIAVRPDRTVNAALRAQAADHELTFASALPEAALRSLLLHLGVLRMATTVQAEQPPA